MMNTPVPGILERRNAFIGSLCRFLMVACAGLSLRTFATDAPREHLPLDAGWEFLRGDDWPGALRLDKAVLVPAFESGRPGESEFVYRFRDGSSTS